MNPKLARLLPVLIQGLLVTPALVPVTAGIARVTFGFEAPNEAFGVWAHHPVGRVLFSPWVVLGGLAMCIGWNVWQVCRVSFEKIHERWVFCLSIQHRRANWGWVMFGTALWMTVTAYVMAENVVITFRFH